MLSFAGSFLATPQAIGCVKGGRRQMHPKAPRWPQMAARRGGGSWAGHASSRQKSSQCSFSQTAKAPVRFFWGGFSGRAPPRSPPRREGRPPAPYLSILRGALGRGHLASIHRRHDCLRKCAAHALLGKRGANRPPDRPLSLPSAAPAGTRRCRLLKAARVTVPWCEAGTSRRPPRALAAGHSARPGKRVHALPSSRCIWCDRRGCIV